MIFFGWQIPVRFEQSGEFLGGCLLIVLGLMVNLARYVRDQSAHQLTRKILNQVRAQMADYLVNNGQYPPVAPMRIINP